MKLVMTLLVRDEADILEANIEFHRRQGVDSFIVTDNLSVDGTREILRRYERQGLVRYIHEPQDDYGQQVWVTRMARLAASEHGADWVVNNDADEFWWPDTGTLKDTLAALPSDAVAGRAARTNFLPYPGGEHAFFADAMTVRELHSLNALGKPLPEKVCHRGFLDIAVGQGNHTCEHGGQLLPAVPLPVTILHFPLRSYSQFENKIAKGGAAYARNTWLPPDIGGTWRKLHGIWAAGGLPAHYAAEMKSAEEITAGLAEGRLVEDRRLQLFLAEHGIAPARTVRPPVVENRE